MKAPSPSLYLAAPCYGGLANIAFMRSVLDLQAACHAQGIGLHVELMGGDALITRARSRLAAQFLESSATHLFFCDADIGFRPENVMRLLAADKDLAGGVYPLKSIDWEKARRAAQAGVADLQAASVGYVIRFIPTPDSSVEVDDAGFAKVAYVGTGFMMIKREAVARVVAAHPELRARMGDMADQAAPEAVMVFDTMIEPETGQYLSEDYAFCRRWRDLGGEIWADMESRLTHVGHAAYSGSLTAAMTRRD
ncbi:MAG: hypothetical protein Q8M88_11120 [Phenylobacterium sp.]|uniref:hypothetical protein n=1 Tax=Phenylobacterium sp. TaxID=1871053 RepID=UPI00273303E5|nr:hypothetical protein [Phenylobacterium sp.]MDP3174971.1 hypothetical protein [Phenylobacterium sp.]